MNGQTRKKLYRLIAERNVEFCRCCGALPHERQLVIDHRDNNNANNSMENLQLLCRKCNYLKNPRRPVDMCESEGLSQDHPSEIAINRTKEPQFKKYVAQRINEDGKVPERDLVYSGAHLLGLSSVTTQRYLDKMCSSEGIYEKAKVAKTVVIRYKGNSFFR